VRPYRMVAGSFLADSRRYTVIVVEDFAARHDIEVGEDVTLLGAEGPEPIRVVGIMAREGPARRAQMVMPLADSQAVFARERRIDAIDVVAEEEIAQSADKLNRLKAAVQDEAGASYEVLYPAARAESIAEALEGIKRGRCQGSPSPPLFHLHRAAELFRRAPDVLARASRLEG
jgi:hypothetical protein